jgi:catechol 2,3-dioxygenase-like lactoylglutathione lyase family enzyme
MKPRLPARSGPVPSALTSLIALDHGTGPMSSAQRSSPTSITPTPPKEGTVPTTTTGIDQISLVCIPAPDQERSVDFYVNKLGLEKRTDVPFGGGYRWIEVYPPNGTAGIALAPPPPDSSSPSGAMQTGITLTTEDIEATHAALKEAGVDVDAEVSRPGDPVPPLFWFRDPDGNVLMVVEQS